MPYNPGTGNVNGVNRNSADVLIPAFLAAYTGKDPKKVGLTAFPSLKSMLPNWRVTYDGLIKIPAVKKYFKPEYLLSIRWAMISRFANNLSKAFEE